jgi:hypothetical protein
MMMKPAAMFNKPDWWDLLSLSSILKYKMRFVEINRGGQNSVIYAFNIEMLKDVLLDEKVHKELLKLGYPDRENLSDCKDCAYFSVDNDAAHNETSAISDTCDNGYIGMLINHLRKRFFELDTFPHEVGFFLGYPYEDVLGFIKYKGDQCKLCGMWKVYGDEKRACELFDLYKNLKQQMLEHIEQGGSVKDFERRAA